MKYLNRFLILFFCAIFFSHCFYYEPPQLVQLESVSEEDEEQKEPVKNVILQNSIQNFIEGDKCSQKANTHPCYEQCKKMYYWKGLDVKECQKTLNIPQINILEDTFNLLWEPDFEELQSLHPDNLKAYLNISNSALSRIIRKYGSKEIEHFILWIIYKEEITKIFEDSYTNFNTLADLLYRVAPYTERDIYEPFIETLGSEKLMPAIIKAENETAMDWFLDFINKTNKACARDTSSKDCFNIYCSIGRAIDKSSRMDWIYFDSFESYLSDIIHNKTPDASMYAESLHLIPF